MSNSVRSRSREIPKKSRKCYHFLLSCCLFFGVLCVCLVTALVFIGKQYYFDEAVVAEAHKYRITRLSDDVIPFSYDIVLKPELDTGNFKGSVNITLKILRETSNIVLHSNGLKIATVDLYNSNKVEVHDVVENAVDELLNITSKELLQVGDYNLIISFHGSLLDRLVGFYRSQYVDQETKAKRLIATSKFEPTYARQAFPCFDEPNKKAHFKVHLLKPKDPSYIALFNMPEINQTETAEGIMVDFEESVKMSTYLSCFIVSDFKATNDTIKSKNGDIPLRVFATPGQLNKTEYALDTAKKVMEFYLDYFNIPYPLPKLDLVAIPDFVSGAMEHWGLVTFRETALLYDSSISSTKNKERVASVIAHELAHSWFGNLVTMNWWNELWLNEGFASYIEYKGVDAAEPSWHMLDHFPYKDMHSVLEKDATLSSHPIVQTVETPDEITAIFDQISYNKGASILRMLEGSVGEEIFQQAVTNYLIKHKFDNAITQDLLDQLQVLVKDNINITEFMNTWTVQMGYPVVNVKKTNGGYEFTQKRFLINEDDVDKTNKPYNYRWTIPITYFTSENSTPIQIWFDYNQKSIAVKSDANWIKLNSKQVGYYRANYGLDNWNALSENIMTFNVGDRSHLMEESFQLAKANQLHYSVPLNLSKYLVAERDYIPWGVANDVFKHIQTYLQNSALYSDYKEYVINLVTPAYTNYTWDDSNDEDHIRKLARVIILSLACSMEYTECLDEANKKFQRWLSNEEELSLDLKDLVYKYGMIKASEEQWIQVWNRFVNEGDAGEKLRLLNGLASINNINLIYRLIDFAKDETYIRNQDYFTCLIYISSNPIGTNYIWHYVRENWETLVKRFGLNDRSLGKLIPTITETFGTQTRLDEMKSFFKKYPNAGAGAGSRETAITTVENNIRWLKKNKEVVEKWLIDNKNETKSDS